MMSKLGKLITLIIVLIMIALFTIIVSETKVTAEEGLYYFDNGDYKKAVEIYNKLNSDENGKQELLERIEGSIDSSIEDWSAESLGYDDVIAMLKAFSNIDDMKVADSAKEIIEVITIEHEGNRLYIDAETYFEKEKYLESMKFIKEMDKAYSQYDSAQELYDEAKEIYIIEISYPESVEQYEQNIQDLGRFLERIDDKELAEEKSDLDNGLVQFKETIKIIDEAEAYYDKEKYSAAFSVLETGLKMYPSDKHLSRKIEEFSTVYITTVIKQVTELVDEEKYEEAIDLLEIAKSTYYCKAFEDLEDAVKDEKSIFHRTLSKISDSAALLIAGWKEELANVKNGDAGAYIVKSGKKILLGDYSEEEVTILSTTGNIAASFTLLDIPSDVRDLTYDIQHWGEKEHFILHLATDVIALVPVIGVVKYCKYIKKADVAVDGAKALLKSVEPFEETRGGIIKHYKYKRTINSHLVGTIHPESGVKYIKKKVSYLDGRMLTVVVPKFDSKVDLKLPKTLYKESFSKQKEWLENALKERVKQNRKLRDSFTEEELLDIQKGILPPGYTWHHSEEEGLMQLVDSVKHGQARHTGGMSLWGIGYKNGEGN